VAYATDTEIPDWFELRTIACVCGPRHPGEQTTQNPNLSRNRIIMKKKLHLLAGAILAVCISLPVWAQSGAARGRADPVGQEKAVNPYNQIEIRNFQDDVLGRISDLSLDLVNGQIVGVLVLTDSALVSGEKVVSVPPSAFYPDALNEVYRLNVTAERFQGAPAVDLVNWSSSHNSVRVAAAYKYFDQDPYFLEEGETAKVINNRTRVPLGYIERVNAVLDLPVGNHQGVQFGKVWSLTLDVAKGRILNVIILAPGNFKTKSIVPAMALSYNAARDGLLLDDTKAEFADQPRYIYTPARFGQDAYYHRESYKGPRTSEALVQGDSYRDIDRTVLINKNIRAAKINGRNVEVGTNNGRVTLRGWVYTADDKRRIGEIAIAASRLEQVDNQINVGKPAR
jgi:sporulation protein YlmC with PRC-barrel domain